MSRRKSVLVVFCMLVTLALLFGLNLAAVFGEYELLSGPFIELQVSGLPTGPDGIWTTIEWQDPYTGEWATVDGWQGTVESDGAQQWWVARNDYGTGPFRWLAFDEEGGEQLGLSDNFNLPEHKFDVVVVQMKPLGQDWSSGVLRLRSTGGRGPSQRAVRAFESATNQNFSPFW